MVPAAELTPLPPEPEAGGVVAVPAAPVPAVPVDVPAVAGVVEPVPAAGTVLSGFGCELSSLPQPAAASTSPISNHANPVSTFITLLLGGPQ